MEQGEIILYQPDEAIKLEVRLENETVWLSIEEMSNLFGRDISVIEKHIRNIFKEEELVKDSVWAKFAYTASDGKTYQVDYYNLDVIISVGYRVKSKRGTQFRDRNSHDRFLIVDDKEVYHIGASMKDLGKKMFAFSLLDIPAEVITNLL